MTGGSYYKMTGVTLSCTSFYFLGFISFFYLLIWFIQVIWVI